ncbi:nicotinate-nucleotide--dimethylbenzimidazole phosphoribosyltransferase [Streptomyces dangxiongensis]|uniref:Nicotinate-nucleotide--dimethylbenzimidazole phosphoribosyltransferase n=1 Tax=Streptomyces dangxiongensis TaxID=1442032 RepID=A0A3G2JIX2_9ACTN|nr:nicotinate-nucleotide--dimethylbenzimidazole phosphoribosyltransferase [Streptomyces dangxiongensis]AYN42283.1 nicotinate-nucleotide--dimethylbenzimidazole phosphoribosyltransferase [Streptomyces dangxiongensis]
MTDTGQIPGEGQPESAGMVEQPGVPPHGAYTYLSEAPAEDEDLLLPGAQGAWGNEVPPPAPEPVVEAVHEPGPHETAGRDSGSVDLDGVRLPHSGPASVPPSPILSAPHDPASAPQPPRRPLHLGPPIPNTSASPVRSLADRGPAGAPVRQSGPAVAAGPEYLDAQPLRDMVPQTAAPWGAAPAPAVETVDPAEPADAAQAAMARLAGQAAAPDQSADGDWRPAGAAHVVHAHDGVHTTPAGQNTGDTQVPVVSGAEGVQVPVVQAAGGVQVPVAQGAEVGAEGPDASVAEAAEGVRVPVAPGVEASVGQGGTVAEATQVPTESGADGAHVADGAQAPVAGEDLPDGTLPAEVSPAGQAVPVADGAVTQGPGPGTAEVVEAPGGASGQVPAQDVEAVAGQEAFGHVPPAAQAPVTDPIAQGVPAEEVPGQAVPAETPDSARPVEATPAVRDASETGPLTGTTPDGTTPVEATPVGTTPAGATPVEATPVDTVAAEAAQPVVAAEPAGGAQPDAGTEHTDTVQAAVTGYTEDAQPTGDVQPTDAEQAGDAVHAADATQPQSPADAQAPVTVEGVAAPVDAVAGQTMVEPSGEAAAQHPGQALEEAAAQHPGQAPDEAAAQHPAQAPDEAAAQHPAQAPDEAAAQAPDEAAAQHPAQAPDEAAAQAPDEAAAQHPAQAPDTAPADEVVVVADPTVARAAETAAAQDAAGHPGATAPAQPGLDVPGVAPIAEPAAGQAPQTPQAAESAAPAPAAPASEAPLADAAQPAVPGAAPAQDVVPARAVGDSAPEAVVPAEPVQPQPVQPAVLQAQGPQLVEYAPQGTDAPAAPALAADRPAGPQPLPQAPDAAVPDPAEPEMAASTDPAVAAAHEQSPEQPLPAAIPEQSHPDQPSQSATPEQPLPAAIPEQSHPDQPSQSATPEQPLPAAIPEQPSAPVIPEDPRPEQSFGQFVPVQGQVPTTPHLAPTPPHPVVLPRDGQAPQGPQEQPESAATVPAPREGEPAAPEGEPAPDVVQHAEDLPTRAADQEESTAAVAEPRQSTGPAAPGYADAEREAVLKVMRERRDIRNGFRSDPIPHEVLLRVLEAAHTAPSVGHSQPWDFVVIRSAETRRTMHELAMRQREAYAKSLPKGRAKQFKELKIEAILDTPVNIVVTADPTRGGRHTLGRHTQPQMAPYSSALAVENLWLAARAEGLGVGWVSFFDEREMVRALGLPEHLEVVAYLCVGYVDEFPDEPELMQAGWSKRRPLSWVVHEETYGRRALPGEDPHDLLAETVAQIRPLDAKALGEAWERQKRMTKPAGALGMLEIISAQLSGLSRQCPPPIPEPAAVAIFAGDHGVHAQGVTPWPQEVTAQMVANFLGGGAVCNAFAAQVGAEVCVVDVGVVADLPATPGLLPRKIRGGTSDMTTGPAMSREEARAAIEVGIETARDLVAAGNKALLTGEMGIANTTASAALISVFTGADPAEVTGRGTGINDETLARKTEVVRRALELHQPDPADPIGVLSAIGGFEHAAMVGLLLGGASLRTPVILDGVSAGAAALVARAIAPEVLAACIAGHRSAEPGHVAALNKLGLRPLVDLDLRLGEGTGALLALPLVQSTARAMHEVATFDSAGVTEK